MYSPHGSAVGEVAGMVIEPPATVTVVSDRRQALNVKDTTRFPVLAEMLDDVLLDWFWDDPAFVDDVLLVEDPVFCDVPSLVLCDVLCLELSDVFCLELFDVLWLEPCDEFWLVPCDVLCLELSDVLWLELSDVLWLELSDVLWLELSDVLWLELSDVPVLEELFPDDPVLDDC